MKMKVRLVEVGPRDGLQNESTPIPLKDKITFVEELFAAGLQEVELSSFVRPEKIPQLVDAKDLTQELSKRELLHKCWLLIPNAKGAEQAAQLNVKNVAFFTSPSESFNQKNINCSIEESFKRIEEAMKVLKGTVIKTRGYLSMVFGCPYEGNIPVEKTMKLIEKFFSLGINEVSLGDTIGVATPFTVRKVIEEYGKKFDLKRVAMHFHDTKGAALVNVFESISQGVFSFDVSAGGLGGCPYAKGSSGNVATEDVVSFLESCNFDTGVDVGRVVEASEKIFKILQKKSNSKLHQYILNKKSSK